MNRSKLFNKSKLSRIGSWISKAIFDMFIVVCLGVVISMFGITINTIITNENRTIEYVFNNYANTITQPQDSDTIKNMQLLQDVYKNSTTYNIYSLIYTFLSTCLVGLGLYLFKLISKQKEEIAVEIIEMAKKNVEKLMLYQSLIIGLQQTITDVSQLRVLVSSGTELQYVGIYTNKVLGKLATLGERITKITELSKSEYYETIEHTMSITKALEQLNRTYPEIIVREYIVTAQKRLDEIEEHVRCVVNE